MMTKLMTTTMTKAEWLKKYAEFMQQRIIGGCSYQYCYDSAIASFDMLVNDDQLSIDDYDPCDAVLDEMECWDD